MIPLRDYIKDHVLLFDGAMGTYYASDYADTDDQEACETANVTCPDDIQKIHEEYISAGARAIRTNTFDAYPENLGSFSQKEIIQNGFELAQKAAAEKAYVFADIGPAPAVDCEKKTEEYKTVIEYFLQCGAENYIFETNYTLDGILESAEYIRKRKPDAFIIISFGVMPDGYTREGYYYRDLFEKTQSSGLADAVGLNCVSGPKHMNGLLDHARIKGCISAMPNAGYPSVRGNRTYYGGNAGYFAGQIGEMVQKGIRITGGCCGTTPKHIRRIRDILHNNKGKQIIYQGNKAIQKKSKAAVLNEKEKNSFYDKLMSGQKPVAVELDPPKNCDVTKFMNGVRELRDAGTDIITIADCPIARARMDSSLLACKIKRELHMDALPHMTCRDRNINAIKALLMGLQAENIRNVLLVTGDPIPSAERNEVRSVFQFNSVKLAAYVKSLNEEFFQYPEIVFGALNINAVNFEAELRKAEYKEEAGMKGFFTQPVLSRQAYENLKTARQSLNGKILGGIIPVVSEKNASFMNSEVNGIYVADKIVKMYQGKNRQESEKLACEISCHIAEQIQEEVDGYYLMTPFGRTGLICQIMKRISVSAGI